MRPLQLIGPVGHQALRGPGRLLLGGVLVSADIFGWHWRSVFAVNIPIAAATLIAAAVIVPETRQARAQRPDYRGLGLLCAALVAIVYPLLEGQALGWPAWTFILIAAGAALVQRHWPSPGRG
jgi:hypothetical protein